MVVGDISMLRYFTIHNDSHSITALFQLLLLLNNNLEEEMLKNRSFGCAYCNWRLFAKTEKSSDQSLG